VGERNHGQATKGTR